MDSPQNAREKVLLGLEEVLEHLAQEHTNDGVREGKIPNNDKLRMERTYR